MASQQPCTGEPVDFYANHGYLYEHDATIGGLVPELEKRGIAESVDGLSIAKLRLLENPVSKSSPLGYYYLTLASVCDRSLNHTSTDSMFHCVPPSDPIPIITLSYRWNLAKKIASLFIFSVLDPRRS
jgi:hypothetical protein